MSVKTVIPVILPFAERSKRVSAAWDDRTFLLILVHCIAEKHNITLKIFREKIEFFVLVKMTDLLTWDISHNQCWNL